MVEINLQELRDATRAQMDLDEEDLPNSLVDLYLAEGYQETLNFESRWPFFQHAWEIVVPDGSASVPRPSDLDRISSLVDEATGVRLWQIAFETAEDNMLGRGGPGVPHMFSNWGDAFWFWPASNGERTYRLRGYRKPIDWVAQGAGAEVDADPRLHSLLVHYAVGRAYAQQEDDVLERIYRDKWLASATTARDAIMSPDHGLPAILNGGLGLPRRVSHLWRLQTP